ncbi:Rieske 2Fe-2S domain-containing protein [Candidatus Chlorohelix sp.]|uniref:Rieske (2Fe-2S) protein n=1 Tax=Candidatus Chlorohelix sp. TaxID=3139201 RepID=UPI00302DE19F
MLEQNNISSYNIDDDGYRLLASVSEVAPGTIKKVILAEKDWEVAIVNTNGKIYAFRDSCPHKALPLSIGRVEGCRVVCIAHTWKFDLENEGKAACPPIRKALETYPVRIEQGNIWVKVQIW